MKLCGEGCHPICDFCSSYDFNGDEEGSYIDNGYCNFHKTKKDPIDECENFTCRLIREGKRNEV
jgi:hypothetical protein